MSNLNSSIPNVGVDTQKTNNTSTSNNDTNFNPNSNTIAIIKQEQPPQISQTNASLANEPLVLALPTFVQPTHNNTDHSINSNIPSIASSAIPFTNTIAPTSTPASASFLAALVEASNSNQQQVSAVPQQANNVTDALQTLVEAHAQNQAQLVLPPTGLFPSTAAIPQQPTSAVTPFNISFTAPAINPSVQAVDPSTNAESTNAPIGQLSASALFLQQQLAAQRASQTQTPTSAQKTSGSSPQKQRHQSPHPSKSTKSIKPSASPSANSSASSSAGAATGVIPPISPNQIQHDLKQLQLHNQRQASAEAAAAAAAVAAAASAVPTPTFGNPANIEGSDIGININDLLSANNSTSKDAGPKLEDQPQPLTTGGEQTLESSVSTITPAINNGGDLIFVTYPGTSVAEGSGTPRLGTPAESDTTTSVNNDSVNETPQIFKATYSGVPVFEMICRGVAVMRRRSDSYLNATQILKVAEFDKPQRTRILEREVQKGEHEKVQGGYGKYQGTWVPYERGVQLCMEYNVLQVLRPLLEYQFSKVNSPPLAPKHVTAASLKPRKPREPRAAGSLRGRKKKKEPDQPQSSEAQGSTSGTTSVPGVSGNGPVNTYGDGDEDVSTSEMDDDETHSRAGSEASMDETMSILSGQSRTPSPIGSRIDLSSSEISDNETYSSRRRRQRSSEHSPRSRKKQHRPGDELFIGYQGKSSSSQQQHSSHSPRVPYDIEMRALETPPSPSLRQTSPRRRRGPGEARNTGAWQDEQSSRATASSSANQGRYAETLLEYFVSDSTTLPSILTHPPSDLDFDLIIDEEGHTPLHWAVAMARTKIVKLLVQHGADIYRVNNQGQTALMRSVLFTNNFDMKTFPSLLEILQKTIFTIDKHDQTVFHHVAATAGTRGKVHASRYYMESLLEKLALHPQELASIINVQDVVGDTALIIAARIGNKKVVRLLLEAGADSKIRNKSGRNADEYIQEAEIQSAAGPSSSTLPSSLHPVQQHISLLSSVASGAPGSSNSHLHQQTPQFHNAGSGIPVTPQKGQQQPYHHSGGMTPSASSVPVRMHGDASPIIHSHPSPIMQSQSAPTMHSMAPSGREGYSTPLSNADLLQNLGGGIRASQKLIPAVTELFAQLSQSYEKDLYEKEQDLLEARNLLHSLQTEIKEGAKTIERLRSRTMYLGQAEERVRSLEGMIRHEINLRHRIRLENLVGQEETRLKREQDSSKDGQSSSGNNNDVEHLLKLEKEASDLRSNLADLQQSRKDQVEQIVRLKSQQGKRRHEYKRLIALCCNVSIDEVEDLLGPLLTTLGSEDGIV